MSYRDPKVTKWEEKLKKVFDRIDDHLESSYGGAYPLHPSRPERGATSNKEQDGLFNIGAAFSPGYGSRHGRGYIVEARMVTLSHVPRHVQNQLEEEVVRLLRNELPRAFPDRELDVVRDGNVFKIVGDLRLDTP
ncbi:MAG: hypothetical protein EOM20_03175 [Spartobacteria bacterium]|nr:hypothetical protein [Spartobacteria bacterium]